MQGVCVTFPTRMNQSAAVGPKMWHIYARKCYQWEMTFQNALTEDYAMLQGSWNSCLDPRTSGSVSWHHWQTAQPLGSHFKDQPGFFSLLLIYFLYCWTWHHQLLVNTYVWEICQGGLWQSEAHTVFSRAAEVNCLIRTNSVTESNTFPCLWTEKRCRKLWRFITSQHFAFHFALFSQSLSVSGPQDFHSRLLQVTKSIKMIQFALMFTYRPLI